MAPEAEEISVGQISWHQFTLFVTRIQELGDPVHIEFGSIVHVAEHPSPDTVLPSSHCSAPLTLESPQNSSTQLPLPSQVPPGHTVPVEAFVGVQVLFVQAYVLQVVLAGQVRLHTPQLDVVVRGVSHPVERIPSQSPYPCIHPLTEQTLPTQVLMPLSTGMTFPQYQEPELLTKTSPEEQVGRTAAFC